MCLRTDLTVEATKIFKNRNKAIYQVVRNYRGIEIIQIEIKSEKEQEVLKRAKGVYITISNSNMLAPEKQNEMHHVLKNELKRFVANKKSILIVGLGNKNICSDSLGPRVVEKIFSTRHIKSELVKQLGLRTLTSVSTISPGVLGQTGIETLEIVKALSEKIKPSLIIVIDALAAVSINRLGTTIQLTNSGIAPGSGVHNSRAELSQKVLNVPVLAIGVPTVVDLNSLLQNKIKNRGEVFEQNCEKKMMVTPKNIDEVVVRAGELISSALNCAIFPMFSKQELEVLSN